MKRRAASALLLLAIALASPWPPSRAAAQPPPPEIDVDVAAEPAEPRVGDRVRITVTVTHPADRLISVADGPQPGNEYRLVETPPAETLPAGDRLVTRFAFVVAPFRLGEVSPGTISLQALREDGSTEEFPVTLPALDVRTTVAPGDGELRPLKPQAEIAGAPPEWQRPALTALGVAGALALLAIVGLTVRRRWTRRPAPLLEPLPPATAEDEARRRLDALRQRDYLGANDLENYYGDLSLIVRSYLEERFAFRATALTRRELERRMAEQGLDRWQIRLVSGLLSRCDAAVYARTFPPIPSADHDLTVAYEIVELARPRRETPEATEAVPA